MYEIFERLCQERGVKPYTVSKETGISTATLTNWKKGNYVPKEDKLRKIAEYFGVSFDYLTTGEEQETYYKDDETAEIAQAIKDSEELRGLFSAAKDCKPETLNTIHQMLLIMKRQERHEDI